KFPTAVPGQPEEGPELCPEPQCGGRKPADQPGPGGGGPTVPQGNETGGAPGRGHRPPRPGPCAPAPVCEPGIPYGAHEGNHYLNRRAALAAEKVARDLGLESAKGAIAEKLSASRTIRGEIKAIHDKVMHWERP